jgi:acyl-CoA ligase (AMP-forming) (exosortase A-associated)
MNRPHAVYTVADLLLQHSTDASAGKVAVVDGSRQVTYTELIAAAWLQAGTLRAAGVARGDRVGICLRRSVEAVAAFFATYLVGGVAVVIHDSLRARQVQHILDHSGARCLVTDTRQLACANGIRFPDQHIINLDQGTPRVRLSAREAAIGADLALIIYTSGSTGLPKGVMLSHANLIAGARIVADYLKLSGQDNVISLLPFSFDYGLNQLLTSVLVGATLTIQRSLFPWDICTTLRRESITGMAGVPALWLQLAQAHSPFPKQSFPHLRYITNSGGRMPEQTVRDIRRWHPHVDIYLMYGLTEAFRSTFLPPGEVDRRPDSIGKAIPDNEILVVGEDGRACAPGDVGELVHRGSTVSLGYWRDPDSTARLFRPHPLASGEPRETVVFSGDLVKRDQEGYFYYVGRKDQLIKSSGFRISPEEIESCVFASELVANVVAFAVPRNETEVEIVAAVIPRDRSTFDKAALNRFCRAEMPEYLRPHVIWPRDTFPLTTSGKPDRHTIRSQYADCRRQPAAPVGAAGAA